MKPIAITMGDPAGVGPELCLQLLENREIASECTPVIFGDAAVLHAAAEKTGQVFTAPILTPEEWKTAAAPLSSTPQGSGSGQ